MPHRPFLKLTQQRVQGLLNEFLPKETQAPQRLHQAMRHSALNPGKRLRPALVYATGEMLGVERSLLDIPALAVELIHAYSLIHDDLPCMDDDDLRRGIPTCHIAFDEATAVLAGDALQTLAFEILSSEPRLNISAESRLQMLTELTRASGSLGMGGGQAIDLEMTDREIDLKTLESMHRMKTGALIDVSVKMGYLASDLRDEELMGLLGVYSQSLGLAFQIRDDILDIEADTETLGKPQGSDQEKNKSTFPALLGLEGAKLHASKLVDRALDALHQIPYNSDNLAAFAQYIIQREY
ncbi:(2E,6E)-farnesyl diphosphate synthase [Aliikangiella coralliicola]|uniref:(2E,6E)-farnesyl diphosphate synthase n=1 Tax=Aliikangiella coralliicola TaxID=2592383 RepID=A0A545U7W9_9GAMM|nr:farnesyl diphosphate synthase [Aliikangiella coralliicola]TQV85564.1 (2E,6E)-farnesyl diphosphate synthase [Aliikangiella coralliicola]